MTNRYTYTKVYLLILAFIGTSVLSLHAQTPDNRIDVNGKPLYLNGGNIAWVNFAGDVGPGTTALDDFEAMFQEVSENGGNSMRFWLHTTGAVTPEFDGDVVVSPGEGTIEDLKSILDLGLEYNVGINVCLWSFDMLVTANGSALVNRNKRMLQDSALTMNYVNNSLIPMVEALSKHPALISWEIFNEPEGMSNEFGWGHTTHVPMADIQRFVNLCAGGIHRADPDALVSNGAWSFKGLWDDAPGTNEKNYYRDDRLIEAGGDSLGTLDFYMVHYYDWAGTTYSPFHHPASYWGLDKPIVVGEFDVPEDYLFGLPADQMYKKLYDSGYAGGWAWQWVDAYQGRGQHDEEWRRALPLMKELHELHPEETTFTSEQAYIQTFEAKPNKIELGGSSILNWKVWYADQVTINGQSVATEGQMAVNPVADSTFFLIADGDTASVLVQVVDASDVNRAYGKKAYASSNEENLGNDDPQFAFDNDFNTRWSSDYLNNQWIYVDLEGLYDIREVILHWEDAYGEMYRIEYSQDAINWNIAQRITDGDGGVDSLLLSYDSPARFVRMYGEEKHGEWGFSLFEMEVKGTQSPLIAPTVSILEPRQDAIFPSNEEISFTYSSQISLGEIDHIIFYVNGDSLDVNTSASGSFTYTTDEEGNYEAKMVAVSNDGVRAVSEARNFKVSDSVVRRRFEAESATNRAGELSTVQDASASRGIALEMKNSGVIEWLGLDLPAADTVYFEIGYNLPYGYKEQILKVNGQVADTLQFAEPLNTWNKITAMYTGGDAIRSMSINHFWGWMWIDYVEVHLVASTNTSVEEENSLPASDRIESVYPNPFNPTTRVEVELASATDMTLEMFDITGRRIQQIASGFRTAGTHSFIVNASSYSSGIYFIRMQTANGHVEFKKITLIK